jgi:hypothetical protein
VPSGVYISERLGEAADGTFLVTIFYDDGDMLFSTYQLNGELPITEIGTWGDNGDGTFTITATGTLEEEYVEPFEVDFTLDEAGNVEIADVTLYSLESVNFSSGPGLAAQFESGLITDTVETTHTLTLLFYDDATAELITGYVDESDDFTEYGEWAVDEGNDQILVTITGDENGDYEAPVEWLFDVTSDDTLVLANDDDRIYGEDGLTLVAVELSETTSDTTTLEGAAEEAAAGTDTAGAGAAESDAAADDTSGDDTSGDDTSGDTSSGGVDTSLAEGVQIFQSDVLPAASSPGLQLTLGLLDDGSAALDYDYLNGEEVITNLGEWMDNGDGTITITFTEGPSGALELPVELTLELDDEGNLVIVDASEESVGLLDVVLAPFALE